MLLKQNKPDGFMCVSCAWAKPADPRVFEFCENGAKATTWEITSCIGGYYPECNPLIPLWHHAEGSKVPAAKSIPVRVLTEVTSPGIAAK